MFHKLLSSVCEMYFRRFRRFTSGIVVLRRHKAEYSGKQKIYFSSVRCYQVLCYIVLIISVIVDVKTGTAILRRVIWMFSTIKSGIWRVNNLRFPY